MSKYTIKTFSLGSFAVNCYLLYKPDTKKAIIIDAPEGVSLVYDYAKKHKIKPLAILLTHGHFDHIKGLERGDLPFYIHAEDCKFLDDDSLNLSSLLGTSFRVKKKPKLLKEGFFRLDSFCMEIIHTPGHTPGSLSLMLEASLFCGDTLFNGSIGRTDLPFAQESTLLRSIKDKLLPLGGGISVFPGHGPSTTIEEEAKSNPFLI